MTQIKFVGICLVMIAMLAGCTVTPQERAFHAGVKGVWAPVKQEYTNYVTNDATLTDAEKVRRVGPSNSLTSEMDALIQERGLEIEHGNQP